MSDRGENMTDLGRNPRNLQGLSNGGGNGDLTRHRLGDLERRMANLEDKVDGLTNLCTRIDEKLNEVASKRYVLWIFGGTLASAFATVLVHVVVRVLGPVS